MIHIGIDPGSSGAVCAIHNGKIIKHKMPLDPSGEIDTKALYLLLRELAMMDNDHMIVHEDVHSVYGASAKVNFSFGRNVGFSLGTLKLSGLKYAMAQPKTWQKEAWAVIPANVRASIKDTPKVS